MFITNCMFVIHVYHSEYVMRDFKSIVVSRYRGIAIFPSNEVTLLLKLQFSNQHLPQASLPDTAIFQLEPSMRLYFSEMHIFGTWTGSTFKKCLPLKVDKVSISQPLYHNSVYGCFCESSIWLHVTFQVVFSVDTITFALIYNFCIHLLRTMVQ